MWNWKILYLDVTNVKFALCQSYGIVNIQLWTQYAHYEIGQGNLKAIKLKDIAFRKNFPNWARLTQCGSRIGIQMNSYQKILFFFVRFGQFIRNFNKGENPFIHTIRTKFRCNNSVFPYYSWYIRIDLSKLIKLNLDTNQKKGVYVSYDMSIK